MATDPRSVDERALLLLPASPAAIWIRLAAPKSPKGAPSLPAVEAALDRLHRAGLAQRDERTGIYWPVAKVA